MNIKYIVYNKNNKLMFNSSLENTLIIFGWAIGLVRYPYTTMNVFSTNRLNTCSCYTNIASVWSLHASTHINIFLYNHVIHAHNHPRLLLIIYYTHFKHANVYMNFVYHWSSCPCHFVEHSNGIEHAR